MIYLFLAEGFEEIEALTPVDVLRRAGLDVRTVGVGGKRVTGAHGITVDADMGEDGSLDTAAEMIILPGGMPGTLNLDASPVVQTAIDNAIKANAFIAAICAAPTILGKRGLLAGKEATCYPSMEDGLLGAILSDKKVVRDGKIITAAGMGVALPFALELVSVLCGEERAQKLKKAVVS
ncbi:MAG: DJ-1/PfpI family protein [Ruminococcaceae bacterium]|nr:DJ-1/PfpI family protein [Oscillospiraceae bacterium]